MAPTILRKVLDEIPLWRNNHVMLRQLTEDFARYLYLPRLQNINVLMESIMSGVNSVAWESETFAYAEMYDSVEDTYRGIKAGEGIRINQDDTGLIIKPNIAAEKMAPTATGSPLSEGQLSPEPAYATSTPEGTTQVQPGIHEIPTRYTRFYASIDLDPERIIRDAKSVADEIVIHLASQSRSSIRVTLEIEANLADGFQPNTMRILRENCNSLNAKNHGFEE